MSSRGSREGEKDTFGNLANQKKNQNIELPPKETTLKNKEDPDLKPTNHLQWILGLNLFVCFGMNYIFDFPQALEDPLIRGMNIDTFKISLLYSLYSLPNIILSPVVGLVISKIGCHLSGIFYNSLVFIGSILVFVGIQQNMYWWVCSGRILAGIGGEGAIILQLTINELWFYGQFLSTSVAWCDVFALFAELLGNIMHPELLVMYRRMTAPAFVMGLAALFSVIVSIAYYILHVKYEHRLETDHHEEETVMSSHNTTSSVMGQTDEVEVTNSRIARAANQLGKS